MSDALVSPAVGGALWAATAALTVHAAGRVERARDEARVPLMGVLGAFVFAAQLVSFSIPGTGSSGHLGGGLLLAILLGPHAAFLVMASVLTVQALFFADGGLLALGCNVFNLGVFSCYLAYPLVWRPIAGREATRGRLVAASVVAGVVGLQAGSLGVVAETVLSGIATLPLATFGALMQAIHLAIGLVEGLVTAAVVLVVRRSIPGLVEGSAGPARTRPLLAAVAIAAVLTGGVLSAFASARPDGLAWSLAGAAGSGGLPAPAGGIHAALAALQRITAVLPGYAFREGPGLDLRPAEGIGTSVSGLVGGALVLALVGATGLGLRALRRRPERT